ncbi:DUF6441 family protein [Azospirillum argentinense]|uniref:HK97 gp10 family phage protein n=1 Tax=Azospirillum brasilense TaxID=192 RepID=A0A4D8Q5P9_AZOBR|nr:DUF6441 family protein [Azospirillum argentinense]QCO05454.1 hypothetical protein D3867_26275 [Azospirillum argentinense]
MRLSVNVSGNLGDLDKLFDDYTSKAARALTDTVAKASDDMKADVRSTIRGAGLGNLGKALDSAYYPGARASLHPAAEIYVRGKARSAAKWEGVLNAFMDGATIRSGKGWLAIPTKQCPKASRGRYMTPDEVVDRFGPLHSVAKGKSVLLFADLVAGRSGGWRKGTAGRAAQGRMAKPVLVFVLVREANIRKRIDAASFVSRWEGQFTARVAATIDKLGEGA